MEINFSSDNRIVNWKYENKSYSYVVEGIIFATESNDMIFLEIYENKTFSYRFINLNGKDILWYDENGNLKLFDSDGHCINEHRYNELKTVKVSKDNIYLMYKNRISVLSRKGDEISKISPPFGYIFYRDTTYGNCRRRLGNGVVTGNFCTAMLLVHVSQLQQSTSQYPRSVPRSLSDSVYDTKRHSHGFKPNRYCVWNYDSAERHQSIRFFRNGGLYCRF